MLPSHRHTESIYGNQIPSTDELPHFMSLSCIPNAISSCLFSSFWEPGVTCNLVSEWLHPVLKEILPPLVTEKQFHVIVHMMAARRPNIAPLWLGAAITGLLPRILRVHNTFLPPTCLEAAVWSSSPQSFMDPEFHHRPQIHRRRRSRRTANGDDDDDDEKAISREGEYRLLYLTDVESQVYRQPPLSPYAPFGLVNLRDAALEVRLHATCGHGLVYAAWIWQGRDGRTVRDPGITSSTAKQAPLRQSTGKDFGTLLRCFLE